MYKLIKRDFIQATAGNWHSDGSNSNDYCTYSINRFSQWHRAID